MQNALYFPHIHVRTDRLMKSALLLWDQIEFITPWNQYEISYSEFGYNAEDTKNLEHAHKLLSLEHVPTEEEKLTAHDRILDFATTPGLPDSFVKSTAGEAAFAIHFEKLFDETWRELSNLGIATKIRADNDVMVPNLFGRATMTILAQCCAGNDTQLVTDSARATDDVRQTTEIEGRKLNKMKIGPEGEEKCFSAVDALNIVDVDKFTLPQLIEFRERELREAVPHQRVFRQNYWAKLDTASQEYRSAKNEAERKRVRGRFRSELTAEFEFLKEELGLSAAEALFTVDTATLVTLGAAIAVGGPLGITAAGVSATRSILGKLTGAKSKKNAAMEKRARAAYMYVFKNAVNAGQPLTTVA
jgi:hypothetical protein